MSYTDTNVNNLIINTMTKAQYDSLPVKNDTELYMITDEDDSSGDDIQNIESELTTIHENINTLQTDVSDLGDQVRSIEEKVPNNASSTNQLVTKDDINNINTQHLEVNSINPVLYLTNSKQFVVGSRNAFWGVECIDAQESHNTYAKINYILNDDDGTARFEFYPTQNPDYISLGSDMNNPNEPPKIKIHDSNINTDYIVDAINSIDASSSPNSLTCTIDLHENGIMDVYGTCKISVHSMDPAYNLVLPIHFTDSNICVITSVTLATNTPALSNDISTRIASFVYSSTNDSTTRDTIRFIAETTFNINNKINFNIRGRWK